MIIEALYVDTYAVLDVQHLKTPPEAEARLPYPFAAHPAIH